MINNFTNQEAETIIIGSILTNNAFMSQVADVLTSNHFAFNEHEKIYNKIYETIVVDGGYIDAIILKNFAASENIDHDLIFNMISVSSTTIDLRQYAFNVMELWQKRQAFQLLEKYKKELERKSFDFVSTDIQNELAGISYCDNRRKTEHVRNIADFIENENDVISDKFTPTGFEKLDNKLNGGLASQQLCIVGARPSAGKTASSQQIIVEASKQGKRCLFLSLEVDKKMVYYKFLSYLSGVESWKIRKKQLMNWQFEKVLKAKEILKDLEIYVNDSTGINILQIDQEVKKQIQRHPIDLVVVDYVQIIKGVDIKNKNESSIIKDITTRLKEIARKYNVAVLALAQINRESQNRNEPTINDFKGSGGIEEDADVAIILHREKDNDNKDNYFSNNGKFIIAKNRHGSTGEIHFNFDGSISRFTESGNF